ncbi:CPBP family glutamic-type intramembrane protease [Niallia circulans]
MNKRVFENRNPFHIAFIALMVAFCEEILFRGVIQTNLGLLLSCLLFAMMHYRYLFNPFYL